MRQSFRTYDLSVTFYRTLLKVKLPVHLRCQLERAAASIALNLQEGSAKSSAKDRRRFYEIALGSFRESMAVLDLINQKDSEAGILGDRLGAHLYKLVKSL